MCVCVYKLRLSFLLVWMFVFRPKLGSGFMCVKIKNKVLICINHATLVKYGRQLNLATLTYKDIPMLREQYGSTIKIYCVRYFHDTQPQLRSDVQRTTNVSMKLAFGLWLRNRNAHSVITYDNNVLGNMFTLQEIWIAGLKFGHILLLSSCLHVHSWNIVSVTYTSFLQDACM
jgi:hypothetical protein